MGGAGGGTSRNFKKILNRHGVTSLSAGCPPHKKKYIIEKIRYTFAAHLANIRRTRAELFTKFAAHLPHIKLSLRKNAALHFLQIFLHLSIASVSDSAKHLVMYRFHNS